jgi:hypothetical protein
MSGAPEADDYFRVIEEEFVRRRGAPLLLSPRDWALMASWREAGIPLRIAVQGIRNVFDAFERRAPTGRRVNSLSYCRQEVLSLFELYRAVRGAEAGRPDSGTGRPPERTVARHLGRLQRRVREAMGAASAAGHDSLVAVLAESAADLRRLRVEVKGGRLDPGTMEEILRGREETVLRTARACLPEAELRAEEREADEALALERGRMAPEAYAATRAAALARRLRRRFALPRMTLFD